MPKVPSWQDVKLVYLDPPYWKQAEGMYDDDESNLANMELDDFHNSMATIIKQFADKLSTGAKIALIIQATAMYPNRDEAKFNDHICEIRELINTKQTGLIPDIRIEAPYSTQQHLPQNVEWAKANKKLLVLNREIIIWEKQ